MIKTITKKFKIPTDEALDIWWNDFKNLNTKGYEFYIVGGFLNKNKTKDIDILVKGPIKKELREVLELGRMLGEQENILIDIFWSNRVHKHPNYTKEKRIRTFTQSRTNINGFITEKYFGGKEILRGLYLNEYEKPQNDYFKCREYKNRSVKVEDYLKENIYNK